MISRRRGTNAQSIIETVVGIIFLIPIVLFLFDIGVLILANTANDNLAKQAARAAAGATPGPNVDPADPGNLPQFENAARTAADRVVNNFKTGRTSGYLTNIALAKIYYNGKVIHSAIAPSGGDVDPGLGNVAVFTQIIAVAPVPFPGFDTKRTFFAKAVEPIVALPPAP